MIATELTNLAKDMSTKIIEVEVFTDQVEPLKLYFKHDFMINQAWARKHIGVQLKKFRVTTPFIITKLYEDDGTIVNCDWDITAKSIEVKISSKIIKIVRAWMSSITLRDLVAPKNVYETYQFNCLGMRFEDIVDDIKRRFPNHSLFYRNAEELTATTSARFYEQPEDSMNWFLVSKSGAYSSLTIVQVARKVRFPCQTNIFHEITRTEPDILQNRIISYQRRNADAANCTEA